jgi:hypothetical protein
MALFFRQVLPLTGEVTRSGEATRQVALTDRLPFGAAHGGAQSTGQFSTTVLFSIG